MNNHHTKKQERELGYHLAQFYIVTLIQVLAIVAGIGGAIFGQEFRYAILGGVIAVFMQGAKPGPNENLDQLTKGK